ncbi:MAG: hypothetical protein H8E18_10745 [FCB group bacterium]|nr:hypothetical protein [FCB group bacterium]
MPMLMKRILYRRIFILFILMQIMFRGELFGDGWQVRKGFYQGDSIEYVHNQIVLGIRTISDTANVYSFFDSIGIQIISPLDRLNIIVVEVEGENDLWYKLSEIKQNRYISYADPVKVGYADATHPDDPYFDGSLPSPDNFRHQWGLHNDGNAEVGGTADADIDAPEAWDYETGDSDVLVAVFDSGIDLDANGNLEHPDLDDPDRYLLGDDFTDETDNLVSDVLGHGTRVTGLIGAQTNNDTGMAGCKSSKHFGT